MTSTLSPTSPPGGLTTTGIGLPVTPSPNNNNKAKPLLSSASRNEVGFCRLHPDVRLYQVGRFGKIHTIRDECPRCKLEWDRNRRDLYLKQRALDYPSAVITTGNHTHSNLTTNSMDETWDHGTQFSQMSFPATDRLPLPPPNDSQEETSSMHSSSATPIDSSAGHQDSPFHSPSRSSSTNSNKAQFLQLNESGTIVLDEASAVTSLYTTNNTTTATTPQSPSIRVKGELDETLEEHHEDNDHDDHEEEKKDEEDELRHYTPRVEAAPTVTTTTAPSTATYYGQVVDKLKAFLAGGSQQVSQRLRSLPTAAAHATTTTSTATQNSHNSDHAASSLAAELNLSEPQLQAILAILKGEQLSSATATAAATSAAAAAAAVPLNHPSATAAVPRSAAATPAPTTTTGGVRSSSATPKHVYRAIRQAINTLDNALDLQEIGTQLTLLQDWTRDNVDNHRAEIVQAGGLDALVSLLECFLQQAPPSGANAGDASAVLTYDDASVSTYASRGPGYPVPYVTHFRNNNHNNNIPHELSAYYEDSTISTYAARSMALSQHSEIPHVLLSGMSALGGGGGGSHRYHNNATIKEGDGESGGDEDGVVVGAGESTENVSKDVHIHVGTVVDDTIATDNNGDKGVEVTKDGRMVPTRNTGRGENSTATSWQDFSGPQYFADAVPAEPDAKHQQPSPQQQQQRPPQHEGIDLDDDDDDDDDFNKQSYLRPPSLVMKPLPPPSLESSRANRIAQFLKSPVTATAAATLSFNVPKLIQIAIEVLNNIALDLQHSPLVESAGGIESILKAMCYYPDNIHIQKNGCLALGTLVQNPENRGLIASTGGIEAVVNAMRRHKADSFVQRRACIALYTMSRDNEPNCERVGNFGGIEITLVAMRQHRADPDAQRYGCALLKVLTETNAANKARAISAGGIASIVTTMKIHEGYALIQAESCAALGNLSTLNPSEKFAVEDAGGIERILQAMKHHPCAEVHLNACLALWKLTSHAEVAGVAIEGGALPLVKAANKHAPLEAQRLLTRFWVSRYAPCLLRK